MVEKRVVTDGKTINIYVTISPKIKNQNSNENSPVMKTRSEASPTTMAQPSERVAGSIYEERMPNQSPSGTLSPGVYYDGNDGDYHYNDN